MEKPKLISWQDLLFSLIVGILLLIGLSTPNLIRFVNGTNQEVAEAYFSNVEAAGDKAVDFIASYFLTPDVATFMLWAALGLVCYLFIAVFVDSTHDLTEAFSINKKYVHPRTFKESTYLERLALRSIVGLLALSALVGWVVVGLRFLVPYAVEQIYNVLFRHDALSHQLTTTIYAVASITAALYGLSLFVRLFRIARYNFQR